MLHGPAAPIRRRSSRASGIEERVNSALAGGDGFGQTFSQGSATIQTARRWAGQLPGPLQRHPVPPEKSSKEYPDGWKVLKNFFALARAYAKTKMPAK